MTTIAEVRRRHALVTRFIGEHPPLRHGRGFLEYPCSRVAPALTVVSFTGRGATPSDPMCGMHQLAAHAAMHGCHSLVVSAHGSSRRAARQLLLGDPPASPGSLLVFGHSHGGDHASRFASEYFRKTGQPLRLLCTIDPVNSPGPLPLTRVASRKSVCRHENYFQRNAPWFGGSMRRADQDQDVSDPSLWPAWSVLRQRLHPDTSQAGPGITHTTIDEDLFLHGVLSCPWE